MKTVPALPGLPAGSVALIFFAAFLALTSGCTLLRSGRSGKVEPENAPAQAKLVDEQIQLQRFTDDFFARGGQALDESADRLGTDAGREEVLRIKLLLGSSLLSIVSGPNPNANLLDMVSLTVLTRMSVQNYWMKTTNGAAFQPWLEASRVLETNVWDLAGRFLTPAQVNELRQGIEQWYARTPEVRTAFFARPHAFASMVRNTQEKDPKSVFSLINLEPAVQEVTQSRLFAERAMYTAQRMPFLLRLQAEQLAYEVTQQPAARMAISNSTQFGESAQRISRAAENISQSVAQMPDRITAERKAVIADLDAHEGKLRDLANGVERAMVSGEKFSGSLNITLTNLHDVMKEFRARESATNARPFNILDYADAADRIDKTVKDLDTLVGSINQSMPGIQRLRQQTDAEAHKIVDHTFRVGLMLIAVLLIGSVLSGLLYSFLAQKLKQRRGSKA